MNNKLEVKLNNTSGIENILSCIFGTAVLGIGIINMFWGNDSLFGVFLALLSFVYFLPVNTILKKITGFTIPKMGIVKIVLGLLIIWAALGVGELFNKIELMKAGF